MVFVSEFHALYFRAQFLNHLTHFHDGAPHFIVFLSLLFLLQQSPFVKLLVFLGLKPSFVELEGEQLVLALEFLNSPLGDNVVVQFELVALISLEEIGVVVVGMLIGNWRR